MVYFLCLVLFCVGLYAILVKRNIMKIIIGFSIIEYAVNLFFVLTGYRYAGRAPILELDQTIENIVDPLPQALVLTTMAIGLASIVLLVAIAIRIYERYGTFDIIRIRRLKG